MEPKELKFEEPKIEVIHLTEKDIITTSGDPRNPLEMEDYYDE